MRRNLSLLVLASTLLASGNAQAQIVTTGIPSVDCNQQSPRLFLNASQFRLGNTARITLQSPHAGAQTIYLLGTTTPAHVTPQGTPLGIGSLVSYINLDTATIFTATTDATGSTELTLPIPAQASLVGQDIYFQAFSLENPRCSGVAAYSSSALRKVTLQTGTPAPTPTTFATSVSSGSITWTFDRSVETGTFYNGHRWVKGPVRVLSISPAPEGGRNGSMVDPNGIGLQAYDSRRNYDAALAATPAVPATLDFTSATEIRSLVSTVSTPPAEQNRFLQEVQVLTIIPANLPNPSRWAFRPSYHRGQKILVSVEELIEEPETLFSVLPSNAQYGGYLPTLADLQAFTSSSTFLVARGDWGTNAFNGAYPGYGRELALMVSHAMLYALHLGAPQRKEILSTLLQMGIDIAGVTTNGGAVSAFRGDGGQMNGRKLPFAAIAKALVRGAKKDSFYANIAVSRFSEDDQIQTGTPWFTPNTGSVFHFSTTRPVDLNHPSTWLPSEFHQANYKFCCTYNVAGGTSIATSLIQAWDAWQNEQFKLGVNGYYRVENLLQQYETIRQATVLAGNPNPGPATWFIDSEGHGTHWSEFVKRVWDTYAPVYDPVNAP